VVQPGAVHIRRLSPHTWAKHMGTSILVNCFGILPVLEFLAWPLTSVMLLVDPLVRRLSGVTAEDAVGSLEERQEELLNVVEEQEKEGVVDEQEREMIESVLEFGDTTAGEIMTPRTELSAIDVKSGFSEAVEILIREGHSRYPVYEENIDNIIGMLYAKDLLVDLNNPDQSPGIQHRQNPKTIYQNRRPHVFGPGVGNSYRKNHQENPRKQKHPQQGNQSWPVLVGKISGKLISQTQQQAQVDKQTKHCSCIDQPDQVPPNKLGTLKFLFCSKGFFQPGPGGMAQSKIGHGKKGGQNNT